MFAVLNRIMMQEGWSQAELADVLGTTPTQISRWMAQTENGSLTVLCDHLRKFAEENQEVWLNLVASPGFLQALPQFRNLTFFDYSYNYPDGPMWVISNYPLEFDIEQMREITANRIKNSIIEEEQPYLVYWVPKSTSPRVRQLFLRLNKQHGISMQVLQEKIKVIFCPEHLFLFSIGILNPNGDKRVGFMSTYQDESVNLRIQVLPSNAMLRICNLLSPVLEEFLFDSELQEVIINEIKWSVYNPLEGE